MKTELAVWSTYYHELSPEDAVREFKKHGFYAAELSTEHSKVLLSRGEPIEVGREFGAFLKEEGFTMTQGHLWLGCEFCTYKDHYDGLLNWFVLYDAIGVENAVLHVDGIRSNEMMTAEERLDVNARKLNEMAEFIKERGLKVRLCLENLIGFFNNIDQMNELIDRLDPDVFGICLDTGHLNLRDADQQNFILKAGNRLHALHIADNEGQRDQHMMPFGKGNVDFAKVVEALREIDYEGLFNLEIPGEHRIPLEIRGYKLDYIKKCYEYLMR
ncbi:MAG: sugar phosphate isomerase/epimerase [Clostridia bacterium]|nr:sugar phosphate isomerase/epimerase [Clostridia bacterium]